jgi:uncharacterized protein YndB with AHSA1/START domain
VTTYTFQTTRLLPYSVAEIYAAFATPERLSQWWGPDGFTNTFEHFDFRVGGRWVFVMHGPDGQGYPNESVFAELVPNEKIVIRHDGPPYFTLTIALSHKHGEPNFATQLEWTQVFDDAAFAQSVRHIIEPANEQNLDRLLLVLQSVGR